MKWLNASSVKELKALGSLDEVRRMIKSDLVEFFNGQKSKDKNIVDMIKITSSSWDGLYDKVCGIKNFMLILDSEGEVDKNTIKHSENNIEYFKTEEDEIIFYILKMDGKSRSEKLGITRECFVNIKYAKTWRNNIYKKIHPDKTNNKNATEAAAKLNQLYKEMIGDA